MKHVILRHGGVCHAETLVEYVQEVSFAVDFREVLPTNLVSVVLAIR